MPTRPPSYKSTKLPKSKALQKSKPPTTPPTTTTDKGLGWTWQKLRVIKLRTTPLCEVCTQQGYTRAASEVDHILPRSKGGTNDWNNLQSICRACHIEKTRAENRRKR